MNAPHPFAPPTDEAAWHRAVQAVNAWRGQAIECFARAEFDVTQTLLAMSAVPDRGSEVTLRRLVGQRFEVLEKAIAAEGPFAIEGERCRRSLAAFRKHDSLRACLCHGTAKVFRGRGSDWLARFTLIALGPSKGEQTRELFEQPEAAEILSNLKKDRKQLESHLRQIREAIGRGA